MAGSPWRSMGLKIHKEVEIVLSDAGFVLDRHRFTLDGAATAIDAVLAACGKT